MNHLRLRPAALAFAALAALAGCASGPAPPSQSLVPLEETPTLRLARAARASGDFASAVNLYRTLVSSSPNPLLKTELGDTLLDAGSIDDAMAIYESIPAGSPAALGATLGLEHAHLMLDDVPKALQEAAKAYSLAPDDPRVLVDRGVALDVAGRHKEAQASYRAVLAKTPEHRSARVDLALSLALTHDYDQAMEIVKPIAMSSTATPKERQVLALIYGLKGDDRKARQWSRLDLDPVTTAENLRFFHFVRDGDR